MNNEKSVNQQERILPHVTVGVYVTDDEGRLLLIRSPKWKNQLVPPGGHIDYGETVEQAAIREVKEETNLAVGDMELLTVINMIDRPDFTKYTMHFVGLQVRVRLLGSPNDLKLQDAEASEALWLTPKEFLERDDLESETRTVIAEYFVTPKPTIEHVSALIRESADYKSGWQRCKADYQNLLREVDEQKKDWAAWSELRVLEEFIPVYDNLKKAFAHHPENGEDKKWPNWAQGIGFIKKQFGDILQAHQIEEIKTVGELFDPRLHESVGEEISDAPEHTIIREVDGGYMMKGKVVKVAKVIVSNKKY